MSAAVLVTVLPLPEAGRCDLAQEGLQMVSEMCITLAVTLHQPAIPRVTSLSLTWQVPNKTCRHCLQFCTVPS